jgi:hypothetical protein
VRKFLRDQELLSEMATFVGPWVMLTVVGTIQAVRHRMVDFPLGTDGFCGHPQMPHCAWCALAALGALGTGIMLAIAVDRPRVRALHGDRRPGRDLRTST